MNGIVVLSLIPANRNRWDCHKVISKYGQDGKVLLKYAKYPELMISARTEINQAEEEITPVISTSLANTPCTTFGVRGLLDQLNDTLGTSYTLDIPTLSSLLEDCIAHEYNFGTAYGSLCTAWYTEDWSSIPFRLRECEEMDRKMRQTALHENHIVQPQIFPRRVWDLYSNRIVPTWSTGTEYSDAISYAWVDEKDRIGVWTPINGRQWPVSIPKDADLNLIRIEMLNMGLEYVWLDVLCLRQRGGSREDLRVDE
ncbi:hypothetical protein EDD85DRAFT_972895 [Armillaria nabsnona]|nr:hypothetical protein EDD85DRAFT_972895 [Armillaria nabsnona]